MLKLLLDENVDAPDADVLVLARKEKRILITHDRDFGRLVFLHSKKHVGVIYIRLCKETQALVARLLLDVLSTYEQQLTRRFVTVSDAGVRFR